MAPVKRKRKKARSQYSNIMRYRGPLSLTQKTTLRYDDMYTITSGGVIGSSLVFSLNGLHDPDFTGAGHQPRGYDQILTMYDHYVVIGAKVDIQFSNPDPNRGMTCWAIIADNSTAVTSYVDALEWSTGRNVQLGARDGDGAQKKISFNINPNKFLGRSHPLSDPQLKGSSGTNPAEEAFLKMGHIAADLATPNTVNITLGITYTVIFLEPKQPTIS